MKRLTLTIVVLGVLLLGGTVTAFATGPQGESGPKGPKSLIDKGWACFAAKEFGVWAHCAPPGEDTFSGPPTLKALNFATFDLREDAEFMGTEIAIRDDLFQDQPCPQGVHSDGSTPGTYEFLPGAALDLFAPPGTDPMPDYWSCHHFDDLSALP